MLSIETVGGVEVMGVDFRFGSSRRDERDFVRERVE